MNRGGERSRSSVERGESNVGEIRQSTARNDWQEIKPTLKADERHNRVSKKAHI